jgi:hypothetical protein
MWRVRLTIVRITAHVNESDLLVRFIVKKDRYKLELPKMHRLLGIESRFEEECEFYLS